MSNSTEPTELDIAHAALVAERMICPPNHEFAELLGKTMKSVTRVDSVGAHGDNEGIIFERLDGKKFALAHEQDCCEHVTVEDITGDLSDLEGEPIIIAEASSEDGDGSNGCESSTWTFYKFATRKGYVDIRFFGSSNGYYSEGVSFFPL